ncbi:MAG: hypothetical protein COV76_02460 [Candidatus Omnitrophica bacterium CG11_big_fil_rev_8_21_14_0_20_64_10]|nr:MAG: hypothetical protein COV76_02460 [Candidatus Omnitrophica bacterium CG11_big_fil_rev_8_21_14_0_20_64_10]
MVGRVWLERREKVSFGLISGIFAVKFGFAVGLGLLLAEWVYPVWGWLIAGAIALDLWCKYRWLKRFPQESPRVVWEKNRGSLSYAALAGMVTAKMMVGLVIGAFLCPWLKGAALWVIGAAFGFGLFLATRFFRIK